MNNNKIFFDILYHYNDIKYIFESGLSWDDKATEILLGKSSQSVRKLADILEPIIYNNSKNILWNEKLFGGSSKKSGRKIINKIQYEFSDVQWFHILFSCYGLNQNEKTSLKNQKCMYDHNIYLCEEKCSNINLCKIHAEKKMFIKNNITKENGYQFDNLKKEEIISNKEEYIMFLNMIYFFSSFSPLSIIGRNFLKRIDVNWKSKLFLVKDFPKDYGIEQEYIYKCICAISNKNIIKIGNQEYIPIKLMYKDKDFTGLENNLYLAALKKEYVNKNNLVNEIELIPLYQGVYITISDKKYSEIIISKSTMETLLQENIYYFKVDFYINAQTDYLVKRRLGKWKECIESEISVDKQKKMISPYYPKIDTWDIHQVVYKIKESDLEGFYMFIDSFGDFAHIKEKCINVKMKETFDYKFPVRGSMDNKYSLLNIYNSYDLLSKIDKKTSPSKEELIWLKMILNKYPNMCRMFISDVALNKLLIKLKNDIGEYDIERILNIYECENRIIDLKSRMIPKYKKILNAVDKKHILKYEY